MEIKKLSDNGYILKDVFDANLYKKLSLLIDTFEPTEIRPTADSPDLPTPPSTARRESYTLNGELYHQVVKSLSTSLSEFIFNEKKGSVELWRDYRGYRQFRHYDAPIVKHILIVYFGNSSDPGLGTWYTENGNEYQSGYHENTGLFLKNSSKVFHGLNGTVDVDDCRKTLYLNWLTT
jgi:hypothetical protein